MNPPEADANSNRKPQTRQRTVALLRFGCSARQRVVAYDAPAPAEPATVGAR